MAKIIFNHCINPFLALTYPQENGGIKSNKTNTTPTKFSPPINMTITKLFNTLLIEVLKCPLLFKENIYTITYCYLEKLNGNQLLSCEQS